MTSESLPEPGQLDAPDVSETSDDDRIIPAWEAQGRPMTGVEALALQMGLIPQKRPKPEEQALLGELTELMKGWSTSGAFRAFVDRIAEQGTALLEAAGFTSLNEVEYDAPVWNTLQQLTVRRWSKWVLTEGSAPFFFGLTLKVCHGQAERGKVMLLTILWNDAYARDLPALLGPGVLEASLELARPDRFSSVAEFESHVWAALEQATPEAVGEMLGGLMGRLHVKTTP